MAAQVSVPVEDGQLWMPPRGGEDRCVALQVGTANCAQRHPEHVLDAVRSQSRQRLLDAARIDVGRVVVADRDHDVAADPLPSGTDQDERARPGALARGGTARAGEAAAAAQLEVDREPCEKMSAAAL